MNINTIGKKIGLGYLLIVLILLLSGAFAYQQAIRLSAISHRIRQVRAPTLESSLTLLNGVNESQSAIRAWLLHHQEAYLENRKQTWKDDIDPALGRLKSLSAQWVDEETIVNFGSLQTLVQNLRGAQESMEKEAAQKSAAPVSSLLKEKIEGIIRSQNQLMDADLEAETQLIHNLNLFLLALGGIGIVVCAGMATLVIRAVTTPILRTIEFADAVANGNYDLEIDIAGSLEIDRLKASLVSMRARLERQTWLNHAQIQFSDAIRGVGDVRDLANAAVAALAPHLRTDVGVLYLTEGRKLKVAGSYAHPKDLSPDVEIDFGQGLAGQAAAEKRPITVSGTAELPLSTMLGDVRVSEIVATPLLYKDEVIGVLELASIAKTRDRDHALLKAVSEPIAITLNAAQKAEQIRGLLHETQTQSEELQAQQEELRNANEELQSRQEELESTNAELEEQKSLLEFQKKDLDRKNVELELAQRSITERAMELDQVSRYKSEFLANMSHELRTPLNSQLILSKLLAENKDGNLTQKQVKFVETIHTTGMDLLQLINDILDLSKVEAGKLSLDIQKLKIEEIVLGMERDFVAPIEQKGLRFRTEVDPGVPEFIRTDPHRLVQVLRNLISNAMKFTERGEIVLRIAPVSSQNREIAFHVKDTGIGIPESKLEAIFQPFEQVDSSTSRKYGGTGLGLAISRSLAQLLGGSILLESRVGEGSTFSLVIPESHESDQRSAEKPKSQEEDHFNTKESLQSSGTSERTILIVEDDLPFARVLTELAKEKGFECLRAQDGEKGLDLARRYRPSCILLDHRLPGMDGLHVLDELKKDATTRDIPVHMISVEDHSQDARRLGAVGSLLKPASPEGIRKVLDRLESVAKTKIRRVLVVDDSPIQRDEIVALIGNHQVLSTGVANAHAAYEALLAESFDCMILDLKLPDMTGFDFLKKIRQNDAIEAPPVIVYTAKELTTDEEEQLRRYSDAIIIKGARSTERLLDEVSLFIYRVAREIPQDVQRIAAPHGPEKAFEGKTVLLVDDDVRNIFALSAALEERGLGVLIARNGQEALSALESNSSINLVLMDVMMPIMDGYEATRRIRKSNRYGKMPVIALTAKAMKEDKELCLAAGTNDYLPKPVDLERLFTLLRVWLSK